MLFSVIVIEIVLFDGRRLLVRVIAVLVVEEVSGKTKVVEETRVQELHTDSTVELAKYTLTVGFLEPY